MPLEDALLLAVKHGVVELTVPVVEPASDDPQAFAEAVHEMVGTHQYQVMTDPTILDSDELVVASCLESRDPMPDETRAALMSLGFSPQASEAGGEQGRSLFSRFQKRQRAKLDRWRLVYLRARDLDPALAAFEGSLVEELPEGELDEVGEAAAEAVSAAARTYFRKLVAPDLNGLATLERRILEARGTPRGRWVLHPVAVRALAGFVGEVARHEAPGSRWTSDPDEPLGVASRHGVEVRSDPEFRVVQWVSRGTKGLLSVYLKAAMDQQP